MGKKDKTALLILTMILTTQNGFSLSPTAIKERPDSISNMISDLMGSRLPLPKFTSEKEAREFGAANKGNDAVIKELFRRACEYKEIIMIFGVNNNFDNQADNYSFYKAAWEAARGISGARIAEITNVVAVGVGNGLNLPFLKEFLEARGFKNVVIQAIDDGWWMEDPTLPEPDKDMRQEIVEIADRVLIGRLGSDEYRIRYVDLFDAFPREFLMKFDVAFLTPNRKDMNISYLQESLKFLKEYGILIIRLRTGQDISRPDLVNFCHDNELELGIYDESVFPNPDAEFQDLMIVIRRANFTNKANRSINLELFKRLIGARMTEVAA